MTRHGRRRLYLIGAGLLVAALVGGRWLAVETAERAWDRSFAGGDAIIAARDLARVIQVLVALISVAWFSGNLFIVYRAIGSVHMPRRLGDLEIVEAVPRRTLLAGAVLLGVVLGTLLSLGTGDWWRHAVMAAAPPRFGVSDATALGRDAGYYVSLLPWYAALQNRTLILVVAATGVVALLYAVIGSLRIRRGRIRASDYARAHVGVLLACLALVIAWGALLDPAEVIGGLHGTVDQAALSVRVPGADVVAAVAIVTVVISLAWAWRDRPTLILAGWAALLISLTSGYFVIPGVVRASGGQDSTELTRGRVTLERIAFGLAGIERHAPPAYLSGEAALHAIPLWDPGHVAAALNAPPSAVALRAPRGEDGTAWLVAPTNAPGPTRLALETDSGLSVTSLPSRDPLLFGPGLQGPLVTSADSARREQAAGVPISGGWRRFAIAWTIQAWGLLHDESTPRVLLWRRDVTERLERLAPFARFGSPAPVLRDGALWWLSWGYVAHEAFPLVRPLAWHDGDVRYLRAGLVGAVRAATGETHLWLAPGYDSLTATWARHFQPLIEPADGLPTDLRAQLAYPIESFKVAVDQLVRISSDSAGPQREDGGGGWLARPREPFQLGAPGGSLWTAIGFESAVLAPRRFIGLCAAAITPRGPELLVWRLPPDDPERLPGELVGSAELRPGQLRIWPTGRALLTVQAQFFDPVAARTPPAPRVAEVYVTFNGRSGRGLTARAALLGGEQIVTDTTLAARWQRVRRLAAQADSALGAGDLEAFGRLWRDLMSELAPPQRPR
ncbi:MAG TPA: UPF0182 family protein [Gemmatimonadales bacterium]|nr:UPF0182 family protein [Gemmatimonadales bacterium]